MKRRNLVRSVQRLLHCEGGMEAIQTVAITAIAALLLIAITGVSKEVKTWTVDIVRKMMTEGKGGSAQNPVGGSGRSPFSGFGR